MVGQKKKKKINLTCYLLVRDSGITAYRWDTHWAQSLLCQEVMTQNESVCEILQDTKVSALEVTANGASTVEAMNSQLSIPQLCDGTKDYGYKQLF